MAKRRPPTFTPPTPIVGRRAQRARVERIRKEREAATAPKRASLKKAVAARVKLGGTPAIEVTRRLLEQSGPAEWTAKRERPVAYWDERWVFQAKPGGKYSYDDLVEWRYRLVQHPTVAGYLEGRTMSVMVDVRDGGKPMTFTAAAASGYDAAMDRVENRLSAWAESYGREADAEGFTRARAVTMLIRRDGVHKKWAKVTRGRVERREKRQGIKTPRGRFKPPAHSKKPRKR